MEKDILRDFETFDEFPDKYLHINKKSNYYFLDNGYRNCIAKRKMDLVSVDCEDGLKTEESFYRIEDGKLVLKRKLTNGVVTSEDDNSRVVDLGTLLEDGEDVLMSMGQYEKIFHGKNSVKVFVISKKNK